MQQRSPQAEPEYKVTSLCLPRVFLQTAIVRLASKDGRTVTVKILIDGCSSRTYIRRSVAEQLGLEDEGSCTLTSLLFGEQVSKPTDYTKTKVFVSNRHGERGLWIKCLIADRIAHPIPPIKLDLKKMSHIQGFPLADDGLTDISQIDMLLGADNMWKVLLPEAPIIGYPTLVPSIFGYLLQGEEHNADGELAEVAATAYVATDSTPRIEDLWSLDVLGITDPTSEKQANVCLDQDPRCGRYRAQLPWKTSERPKSNLRMAIRRLQQLEDRLTQEQRKEYDDYFADHLRQGVIEAVPADVPDSQCYFLPHFGISRPGKPLRVVFDGSVGINKYLEVGPNLLQDLFAILLRCRTWPLLIQADIKGAFLQVEIKKEADRNKLPFLWNGSKYRFTRLPFGLCCSPFILNSITADLLQKFHDVYPATVQKLRDGLYVDDTIGGGHTEQDLQEFKEEAAEIFQDGCFDLRKWKSTPTHICPESADAPVDKILGIGWDRENDVFILDPKSVCSPEIKTKRDLVASVSRFFDPLGLASSWHLRGKILIQRSWIQTTDWDAPLSPEVVENWKKWSMETCMHQKTMVQIPRYVTVQNAELHVFSDASQCAYSACVFLKSQESVSLLCARSRVAPLKGGGLTIPKLELTGCLLAARLVTQVKGLVSSLRELPTYFWTDSSICLHWIRGADGPFARFIKNRVNEIRRAGGAWNHVPGVENPADIGSRGCTLSELIESSLWWHGPLFLRGGEDWPEQFQLVTPNETLSEELEEPVMITSNDVEEEQNVLFDLAKFSSMTKVLHVTAFVQRFIRNVRASANKRESGPLTKADVDHALTYWLKLAQRLEFQKELEDLEKGKRIHGLSRIRHLHPTLSSEGVMVGQPRNGEPPLPILPSKGIFTRLIFEGKHRNVFHSGPAATLTAVREQFNVLRGRTMAKSVLASCRKCRRYTARPAGAPEGALPTERVTPAPPFSVTGVDFFGPLYCGIKIWILLFTCGVVRAVHMEVVEGQSMEATSLALRRFFSRTRVPQLIISGNVKTFKNLTRREGFVWVKYVRVKISKRGDFAGGTVRTNDTLLKFGEVSQARKKTTNFGA